MTGLTGFAWIIFGASQGQNISFLNESIKYQMPMLIGTIALKYISLAINGFVAKKSLFYFNLAQYLAFVIIAFIIDYKIEFFGA
jgi:hypothetical protein